MLMQSSSIPSGNIINVVLVIVFLHCLFWSQTEELVQICMKLKKK